MKEIQENPEFYEVRTTVENLYGLHARPCLKIVETLGAYENSVWVTKENDDELDEIYTDGKSIMCMMMLAA